MVARLRTIRPQRFLPLLPVPGLAMVLGLACVSRDPVVVAVRTSSLEKVSAARLAMSSGSLSVPRNVERPPPSVDQPPGPDPDDGSDPPAPSVLPSPPTNPLVLIRRNDAARFELSPETGLGGFDDEDLALARQAFASQAGETHEVYPRLLDLMYQAAQHFKAPHVLVTSGYRPAKKSSMHAWGRAVDLTLPGVDFRKLADHLRTYGFVGVGIYPRTGNVHLDVRDKSYFWMSWAPRGKQWREQCILPQLAKQVDQEALAAGIEPPEPLPAAGIEARESAARRRRRVRFSNLPAKARGGQKGSAVKAQGQPGPAQSRRDPP